MGQIKVYLYVVGKFIHELFVTYECQNARVEVDTLLI